MAWHASRILTWAIVFLLKLRTRLCRPSVAKILPLHGKPKAVASEAAGTARDIPNNAHVHIARLEKLEGRHAPEQVTMLSGKSSDTRPRQPRRLYMDETAALRPRPGYGDSMHGRDVALLQGGAPHSGVVPVGIHSWALLQRRMSKCTPVRVACIPCVATCRSGPSPTGM